MPNESLAQQLRLLSEVPPEFELFDLSNDPDEHHNLIGNSENAEIEKKLKAQLAAWRRQTSDPFLSEAFVERFSNVYEKNYQRWKSLGGDKMKDKDALDFSEFIPVWDPSDYLGKKDH